MSSTTNASTIHGNSRSHNTGIRSNSKAEFAKRMIEKHFIDRDRILCEHESRKQILWITLAEVTEDSERKLILDRFLEQERGVLREQLRNVTVEDFQKISLLGRGSSGEVSLVKYRCDGQLYALKSIMKSDFFKCGSTPKFDRAWIERNVLAESDSPFLTRLRFSFQDQKYLYFVVEYHPGGDLVSMLIRNDVLSEDSVRFYAAELALAIDALHSMGVIHRDIKPDNVLFDERGHIKLCDFGLSKSVYPSMNSNGYPSSSNFGSESYSSTGSVSIHGSSVRKSLSRLASMRKTPSGMRLSMLSESEYGLEKSGLSAEEIRASRMAIWHSVAREQKYSAVGTPNYCSPEVISRESYGREADWWSFGCILYEMLLGYPPFYAKDATRTVYKIYHWKKYLKIHEHSHLSMEARDLLSKLICSKSKRIGGQDGVEELKMHPFFTCIDWNAMEMQLLNPPFQPELKSWLDLRYFDDFLSEEKNEEKGSLKENEENEMMMRKDGLNKSKSVLKVMESGGEKSEKGDSFVQDDELMSSLRESIGSRGSRWSSSRLRGLDEISEQDVAFAGFSYKRPSQTSRRTLDRTLYSPGNVKESSSLVKELEKEEINDDEEEERTEKESDVMMDFKDEIDTEALDVKLITKELKESERIEENEEELDEENAEKSREEEVKEEDKAGDEIESGLIGKLVAAFEKNMDSNEMLSGNVWDCVEVDDEIVKESKENVRMEHECDGFQAIQVSKVCKKEENPCEVDLECFEFTEREEEEAEETHDEKKLDREQQQGQEEEENEEKLEMQSVFERSKNVFEFELNRNPHVLSFEHSRSNSNSLNSRETSRPDDSKSHSQSETLHRTQTLVARRVLTFDENSDRNGERIVESEHKQNNNVIVIVKNQSLRDGTTQELDEEIEYPDNDEYESSENDCEVGDESLKKMNELEKKVSSESGESSVKKKLSSNQEFGEIQWMKDEMNESGKGRIGFHGEQELDFLFELENVPKLKSIHVLE